jgi:hypothetical protein
MVLAWCSPIQRDSAGLGHADRFGIDPDGPTRRVRRTTGDGIAGLHVNPRRPLAVELAARVQFDPLELAHDPSAAPLEMADAPLPHGPIHRTDQTGRAKRSANDEEDGPRPGPNIRRLVDHGGLWRQTIAENRNGAAPRGMRG